MMKARFYNKKKIFVKDNAVVVSISRMNAKLTYSLTNLTIWTVAYNDP